jgi:hypothetical protein
MIWPIRSEPMSDEQSQLLMLLGELEQRYRREAEPIVRRLAEIKARDFTVVLPVGEVPQELLLRLQEQPDA